MYAIVCSPKSRKGTWDSILIYNMLMLYIGFARIYFHAKTKTMKMLMLTLAAQRAAFGCARITFRHPFSTKFSSYLRHASFEQTVTSSSDASKLGSSDFGHLLVLGLEHLLLLLNPDRTCLGLCHAKPIACFEDLAKIIFACCTSTLVSFMSSCAAFPTAFPIWYMWLSQGTDLSKMVAPLTFVMWTMMSPPACHGKLFGAISKDAVSTTLAKGLNSTHTFQGGL